MQGSNQPPKAPFRPRPNVTSFFNRVANKNNLDVQRRALRWSFDFSASNHDAMLHQEDKQSQ